MFAHVDSLLFHLHGVLYDGAAWRRWLFQLLYRMGIQSHFNAFFRVWECEYLPLVERGELEYWEALGTFLRAAGLTAGQASEVEAAARPKRKRMLAHLTPFPTVLTTLRQLRLLDYQLSIVSLRPISSIHLQETVQRLGLDGCFDELVETAAQCPVREPRRFYQQQLRRTGTEASRTVLVSHEWAQIDAARELGMRTVAFNHSQPVDADLEIEQFADLLPALQAHHSRRLTG